MPFFRRSACDDDIAEFSNEPYASCMILLSPIMIGNPGATEDQVTKYCTASQDCSGNIDDLLARIGRDCGSGVSYCSPSSRTG